MPFKKKRFTIFLWHQAQCSPTLSFDLDYFLSFWQSERLTLVLDHLGALKSLCSVLGMDFEHTINEVDPSFGESEEAKNICNDTIQNLAATIQRLQEVKLQRMQRVCG